MNPHQCCANITRWTYVDEDPLRLYRPTIPDSFKPKLFLQLRAKLRNRKTVKCLSEIASLFLKFVPHEHLLHLKTSHIRCLLLPIFYSLEILYHIHCWTQQYSTYRSTMYWGLMQSINYLLPNTSCQFQHQTAGEPIKPYGYSLAFKTEMERLLLSWSSGEHTEILDFADWIFLGENTFEVLL